MHGWRDARMRTYNNNITSETITYRLFFLFWIPFWACVKNSSIHLCRSRFRIRTYTHSLLDFAISFVQNSLQTLASFVMTMPSAKPPPVSFLICVSPSVSMTGCRYSDPSLFLFFFPFLVAVMFCLLLKCPTDRYSKL